MNNQKYVYCDYAAATPMDQEVFMAMEPYFSDNFYNPSAIYLAGKSARKALENARSVVARQLGSRPSEIIFTAGGSEANNLAIRGVMNLHRGANCVVSAIEHDSVIKPAQHYRSKLAKVNKDGQIDLARLINTISDKTVLLSVMLVNNELGSLQPIREIAKILQSVRVVRRKKAIDLPIYLHVDACQAPAYFDLSVHKLGVDLLTINSGKIYGPKQAGVLYVRAGIQLDPIVYGGGQEFGFRSGTENVASAVGLARALELATLKRQVEVERISQLRHRFETGLKNLSDEIMINGGKKRAPHISHITINGIDNERFMMELDERGVQCAVGSACSASSDEPSHVLKAVGLSDQQARSSLRFSFGQQTTLQDIDFVFEQIQSILKNHKSIY